MAERMRALDGVVPGVFADPASAEAAIANLRQLGFADDELGVIVTDPVHHRLIDDSTRETMTGLERGILIGTPLGVLGGVALAALAAPGIGVIGLGGVLLFGCHVGALWGAITGAYLGLTAEIHHLEDVEEKYEIPLAPHEVLMAVVTDPERSQAVCETMQRHGARCVRETVPRAPGAGERA
jgi:hypothetical protein